MYLDLMTLGASCLLIAGIVILGEDYRGEMFALIAIPIAFACLWSLVGSWQGTTERRWALMATCALAGACFLVADQYTYTDRSNGYAMSGVVGICFAYASMLLGVYLFLKWKNEAKETG